MQFGRPDNPDAVDFSLPTDPPINDQHDPAVLQCKILLGATGWGNKDWKGKIYPPKAPVSSFLGHYGDQFQTVELNSMFYNIPKADTILKWKDSVPDDFRFSPKVVQWISHSRMLGTDTDRIERFQEALNLFGDKLGPSFLQLPPHFDRSKWPILQTFCEHWGSEYPLAIEFRHPSWFEDMVSYDDLTQWLYTHRKGLVITDVGGRRDVCHMGVTTDYAMVRFVGNDLHPSDFPRVDDWVERLLSWVKKGISNLYFFIHEPDNANAPELASYIYNRLSEHNIFVTRGPRLQDDQPQLGLF